MGEYYENTGRDPYSPLKNDSLPHLVQFNRLVVLYKSSSKP